MLHSGLFIDVTPSGLSNEAGNHFLPACSVHPIDVICDTIYNFGIAFKQVDPVELPKEVQEMPNLTPPRV
jgi:hypothetical protein